MTLPKTQSIPRSRGTVLHASKRRSRRRASPFVTLCLLCLPCLFLTPLSASAAFRVVIDPGHGGSDLGTTFDNGTIQIAEKDVTLALAQETARELRAKGIEAILTRTKDQELPLPARTAMANKLKADVFISIHMNSTAVAGATIVEGVETFILNNTTDASSRRLAQLENAVLGGVKGQNPVENDVALILKDLRLDANLSESKRLACSIQEQLSTNKRNRGVKQALFYVLLGADMPSVLVEAGFLNSARDRELVLSPTGQKKIAKAITQAMLRFSREKNTPKATVVLSRCQIH